jgi:hypothetical protein
MAGYKDRVVTLEFDEDEDGGRIYVALRNPRKVPATELQVRQVARDAAGNAIDPLEEAAAVFELYAKLIVGWRAYDATTEAEDQPLLDSPATPELVAKLPSEIQEKIAEEVWAKKNPTTTPTTGS